MRLSQCGVRLIELAARAKGCLIIAAPFVKTDSLSRILSVLSPDVALTCVTRWRVDEIRCGVSDPGVWPLLNRRPKSKLLLQQKLHAKYYRADNTCVVGSANVTDTALGWSNSPNLELLTELQTSFATQEFEEELLRGTLLVTEDIYGAVADLRSDAVNLDDRGDAILSSLSSPVSEWIPQTRDPRDLWTVYSGQGEKLIRAARETAARDLSILRPAPAMDRLSFNAYLAIALRTNEVILKLDDLIARQPRRFGEVTTFLREKYRHLCDDPTIAWQTLMRWLMYHFPNRYECAESPYSEVISLRIRTDLTL